MSKVISFNEDGSMKSELKTAFDNIGWQMETILNGIKPNWDRIDEAVDAETDKEALQELNEK